MTALACIVAEDEPLVRERVAMLAREAGLHVVGEAADGTSAFDLIRTARPDIAFLDIRMPGFDGMQLLARLQGEPEAPVVVLVTAHAEHALTAFELAALDYVLKPVERERFAVAVARASEAVAARSAHARLQRLRGILSGDRIDRLTLRDGPRLVSLPVAEIERARALDDYVEIFARGRTWLIGVRLSALEAALPAPPFLRVHRSHLVHANRIVELSPNGRGGTLALLDDGTVLPVARNRAPGVRQALRAV